MKRLRGFIAFLAIGVIFISSFILGCYMFINDVGFFAPKAVTTMAGTPGADASNEPIEKDTEQEENQHEEQASDDTIADPVVRLTVSAAGDCTLGRDDKFSYGYSFNHELEQQNNDYSYFFKNVRHIFEADDLTIVNLEGPLTDSNDKVDKEYAFKGSPDFVQILKEGSVEATNIANNHIKDYKEQGLLDTISNLEKQSIVPFGYDNMGIYETKGIKVGLLGYSVLNRSAQVKKTVTENIQWLKDNGAKLIIVSFHWGEELTNYPDGYQIDLAHYTVDQGANLIIGHHPHVIAGVEHYNSSYIVYSLGNFCFGGNRNPKDKDTFIFQQTFAFLDGELINEEQSSEDTVKIIPAYITSVPSRNNFQPTPAEGEEADRILGRITEYSKKL